MRNLAFSHFNLADGHEKNDFYTASLDAFMIANKIYRSFDDRDDCIMLKATEDRIRNLRIVIDSYEKDIRYIKESSNYKFMTGRRKVRPIKMPVKVDPEELRLKEQ